MLVLSIDPGVNNTGLSVLEFKEEFTVKESCTVKNARKFTEEEKVTEQLFGNRAVKVLSIINEITNLITKYKIENIVIEAPFYNALTPVAYGSLLEVIMSIKYLVVIPNKLNLKLIEPLLVKKLFAKQSLASKDIIKQFLQKKIEANEIIMGKSVDELSEHEIDSIAVGYVHYLTKQEESLNVVNGG